MAYATIADVTIAVGGADKLAQLTDYDNDGDTANTDAVASAIAEAEAIIDTYAGKRYAVPIASPPLPIVKLAARMASRILRENRSMQSDEDLENAKRDTEWLKMLSDGRVSLGVEPTTPSALMVDKAVPRDSSKAVSRRKLRGYR